MAHIVGSGAVQRTDGSIQTRTVRHTVRHMARYGTRYGTRHTVTAHGKALDINYSGLEVHVPRSSWWAVSPDLKG